jgi:4-hydroxy-tetrahydrodipicolinate synthase
MKQQEHSMFSGMSAFPLTPINESGIDEKAFSTLVVRLADAGVDSIGALGSTGNYAYMTRQERARVAKLAVDSAQGIPVMIGIGALRTRDILLLAEDAQAAGASAVLLAPVSYQKLTPDEVFALYEQVTRSLSVPLCVYDNPGTTHFEFSDELHGRIGNLPNVASIKIPGVPSNPVDASARVKRLRELIPPTVSIGVSGDMFGATGLNAGCDVWYSVLGGLFPRTCLSITRAAQRKDVGRADTESNRLEGLWALFRQYGSLRVVAAAAEALDLTTPPSLPLPLQPLPLEGRKTLEGIMSKLELH